MNVLKNIVVGCAGFFALACTAVALWFVSSYLVFSIAGYFLGGRQVSGLHVAWALIAILLADGLLMIVGVHYILRFWRSRKHRAVPCNTSGPTG
jgi:hypothetical protein